MKRKRVWPQVGYRTREGKVFVEDCLHVLDLLDHDAETSKGARISGLPGYEW